MYKWSLYLGQSGTKYSRQTNTGGFFCIPVYVLGMCATPSGPPFLIPPPGNTRCYAARGELAFLRYVAQSFFFVELMVPHAGY